MTQWQYMLDTNAASHMIRFPQGSVTRNVVRVGEGVVCVSALVASELRFGARKRASSRLTALVEELLKRLDVVPYDDSVSFDYALIRDDLARRGALIGPVDLFISAHAKALDLTLVTDNVSEFSRVERLRIENWVEREDAP